MPLGSNKISVNKNRLNAGSGNLPPLSVTLQETVVSSTVTYDISSNGSSAYIVSNMGFGKGGAAFNNPELTVRNESTIAFDLNGLAGAHPFNIRSGNSGTDNFSNTLIHVATDGTISTGASAQGKTSGVLYWQIPHDIVSSGRDSYTYVCSSHSGAMYGNVNIKDTGAI